MQFGPIRRAPPTRAKAAISSWTALPLGPASAKPARIDDYRPDAFCDAFPDCARGCRSRCDDDGHIDRVGYGKYGRVSRKAEDLTLAGVHRVQLRNPESIKESIKRRPTLACLADAPMSATDLGWKIGSSSRKMFFIAVVSCACPRLPRPYGRRQAQERSF